MYNNITSIPLFWRKCEETYPEHVSILQVGLRVALLGVDKVGELRWVADKEHGSVVEHPVEVALLSLDLDGKAYRAQYVRNAQCVNFRFTYLEGHEQCPRSPTRHRQ